MAGVAVCWGVYLLVDHVWNGSFVDWFENNYMVTHDSYQNDVGITILVREPAWYKIKRLILAVFAVNTVFWILIVSVVSYFRAKVQVQKSITNTSCMLHDFMDSDYDGMNIFPKEYAEISARMSEIKATMQRHEHILQEESSRKNDLIAYLAHDLKTPLTSIIGYLSLLDEAPDMPMDQKIKYVHITLDKALRLEKLINEFFDITRYNLGQIDIEKEEIDLYYMLVQMADEFYPLLQTHGNKILLNVDETMSVFGDPIKLARVFNNILKNAIAYSDPDTSIKIWVEETDRLKQIYFQNKGKTIPAHKLESIFDKFFRIDDARTSNTGGAGLGLAIAREIITLHGGSIKAVSENDVTTFCVSLPLDNI